MKPMVLRSLPSGGVLCRVETPDEAGMARLEHCRDGWWINANHYCGDGLVIEEETSTKRRKALKPKQDLIAESLTVLDETPVV
jgi:hypothetical protein